MEHPRDEQSRSMRSSALVRAPKAAQSDPISQVSDRKEEGRSQVGSFIFKEMAQKLHILLFTHDLAA
jgi:hypothetical protein